MDLQLQGKRVLVTGSTSGIGKKIAERYPGGRRHRIHQRPQPSTLPEDRRRVGCQTGSEGRALAAPADLSDAAQSDALLADLEAQGGIDILINNTGIFEVKPFAEITDEEWTRYFNVNILSAVRLCRALLPAMLERDYGRIVNISSECAIKPLGQMVHYSVTKTALLSLSRALAELTKGKNVTVNSVLPGPTWTEGVENYFDTLAEEEGKPIDELTRDYFADHEPTSLLQRFVDVAEVAEATVYPDQQPRHERAGLTG